jgi:hypothetical protein
MAFANQGIQAGAIDEIRRQNRPWSTNFIGHNGRIQKDYQESEHG